MNGGFFVGGNFRNLGNFNKNCICLHFAKRNPVCTRTPVPLRHSQASYTTCTDSRPSLLYSTSPGRRSRAYSSASVPLVRMGETSLTLRYVDIGINLSDPVFQGNYHGKQVHESDLDDIIQRARDVGCQKFMVTGSDLEESKRAIEIAQKYPGFCYATVGIHPCQAKLFDSFPGGPEKMLEELRSLALEAKQAGHAVAFGEFGLDYDRLFLSPKEPQLKYFEAQLDLAIEIQLPLFLHSRAASEDFEKLLASRLEKLPKRGLVHSFTGTMEEMSRLVALGLDIGVNGCSLKTEENLEVVKAIPLERIQIETDGPWVKKLMPCLILFMVANFNLIV
ncbi:hypothetical protein BDV10DRAFT_161893 [Aspergillus recurvatus]